MLNKTLQIILENGKLSTDQTNLQPNQVRYYIDTDFEVRKYFVITVEQEAE